MKFKTISAVNLRYKKLFNVPKLNEPLLCTTLKSLIIHSVTNTPNIEIMMLNLLFRDFYIFFNN